MRYGVTAASTGGGYPAGGAYFVLHISYCVSRSTPRDPVHNTHRATRTIPALGAPASPPDCPSRARPTRPAGPPIWCRTACSSQGWPGESWKKRRCSRRTYVHTQGAFAPISVQRTQKDPVKGATFSPFTRLKFLVRPPTALPSLCSAACSPFCSSVVARPCSPFHRRRPSPDRKSVV